MSRKKSNRWIKVWVNEKYLYFKNLQEVADYFGYPSKQFVSDIIHGRRGTGTKLDGTISYVNKDFTDEEIINNNVLKESMKEEVFQQHKSNYIKLHYWELQYQTYSKDYWIGRMERAQLYTDANIINLQEEYRKIYSQVRSELQRQIDLIEWQKDYGDKPLTRTDIYNSKRYKLATQQISLLLNDSNKKMQTATRKYLEENYKQVSKEIAGSADMFFQIDERKLKLIVDEVWCADGKNWSQRIWKSKWKLEQSLKESLVDCIAKGYNSYRTAQKIAELCEVSYSNAKRLASTELAHIETRAAQDRYKEYGITQWEVLPTHDEKTCPICSGLEGKKYSIDTAPVPVHCFADAL